MNLNENIFPIASAIINNYIVYISNTNSALMRITTKSNKSTEACLVNSNQSLFILNSYPIYCYSETLVIFLTK